MNLDQVLIRQETKDDIELITEIHDLAFSQPNEGRLVNLLRKENYFEPSMSLIAELKGEIIGHILFSNLECKFDEKKRAVALAPVAIKPKFQNQGVGSKLITFGVKEISKLGYDAVLVLGEPNYYKRFEFSRSVVEHVQCPYQCEAFLGLEFKKGTLAKCQSVVYPKPFEQVG